MPVQEITLEELQKSYDWEEAFGEGSGGNTDAHVDPAKPGASVSTAPCPRSEVAEIIAAVNGENDGAAWVGVFRMKDGRYLACVADCDYTGWYCQAKNNLAVADTLEECLQFGIDPANRERLGFTAEYEKSRTPPNSPASE